MLIMCSGVPSDSSLEPHREDKIVDEDLSLYIPVGTVAWRGVQP